MTLKEFNMLDLSKQAEMVWSGDFIEHRMTSKAAITLYSLGCFFVEAWYSPDHDRFLRFHAFQHQTAINLYDTYKNN